MSKINNINFDYLELDEVEKRGLVGHQTIQIREMIHKSAGSIIKIGERLLEVKELLQHGQFQLWLEKEFSWSERTARNFMNVAQNLKSATVADLRISSKALYLLASPSTPENVRKELISKGRRVTHEEVKKAINKNNPSFKTQEEERMIHEKIDESHIPLGKQQKHLVVSQKDRIRFCKSIKKAIEKGLHLFCHASEKDTIKILISFSSQAERILNENILNYENEIKKVNIVLLGRR